jgi:uncharacterized protein (TIRG00374 family)
MPSVFKQTLHYIKSSPILKLCLKIVLTLAALSLVFYEIDFERLAEICSRQERSLLIFALLLFSMQVIVAALRWRLIILKLSKVNDQVFSLWEALKICYIGMFFNNCLPGGTVGGDAVRVWLARSEALSLSLCIHSVIIDRIVALIALALMVLLTLPLLGNMSGFDGIILLPFIVLLFIVGIWIMYNIERLLSRWHHLPLVKPLLYFVSSLRELMTHPRGTAIVLGYAFINHILYCLAVAYIAESMGINLSVLDSLVLIPPVVLAATLPITVGGWGVRELAMIGMLAFIGIPQEEALIVSLEGGIMSMVTGMPGGLFWLLHRKHGSIGPGKGEMRNEL